ncbi:MAG: hypothetical protein K6C30_02245 [Bacteroidaceae bacterium]|nr:hypothetical protein [Bacteroidaceae bacterium]
MFNNEQLTAQMEHLFNEGRRYWELQKQYLSLQSVEVLTRLLSTVVLILILILVGSMVLLFASFALAFWLGEMLDSTLLGFGIIAGVLLLLFLLVYAKRNAWIVRPTTAFMVNLLASTLTVPTQEAIALEKEHLRQQLDDNQREIKETTSGLLAPQAQARNKWDRASNLFQNGMAIYRGIQMGVSVIAAVRGIFKLGRRRR